MPMLNFVPGSMGGTETYTRELLGALARRDDVAVTGFVGAHADGSYSETGVDVETVQGVRGGSTNAGRLRAIAQGAANRSASRAVEAASDIVHFPFTVPVPRTPRVPTVLTLHDVQHLDLPRMFHPAERLLRRVTYDRAARRADAVVTVSKWARSRIVELLGIPGERVHVAHLGINEVFEPTRMARTEAFVLYPARRWPHKNHARLVEAMRLLRRSNPSLRLVLTGGGCPLPDVPDWVDQLGEVPAVELASLYRRAACLAYPSLYEGFGLPVVEAMASGCPVAVSMEGSLPEVSGGAATLCDPYDIASIARSIEDAMAGRGRLVPLGLARARDFAWQVCAEQHVEIYRSVLR